MDLRLIEALAYARHTRMYLVGLCCKRLRGSVGGSEKGVRTRFIWVYSLCEAWQKIGEGSIGAIHLINPAHISISPFLFIHEVDQW